MRTALEWERERNEINTGNMWRSLSSNIRVQLPGLLTRDNKLSRTADTTNAREGENEMSEKEIMCVYCKQPLQDLHAISGRKIDPHYATKDQDFGCDNNPINTEEGVGDHEPNLEKYYGVRV
jgi:hypothetical protein